MSRTEQIESCFQTPRMCWPHTGQSSWSVFLASQSWESRKTKEKTREWRKQKDFFTSWHWLLLKLGKQRSRLRVKGNKKTSHLTKSKKLFRDVHENRSHAQKRKKHRQKRRPQKLAELSFTSCAPFFPSIFFRLICEFVLLSLSFLSEVDIKAVICQLQAKWQILCSPSLMHDALHHDAHCPFLCCWENEVEQKSLSLSLYFAFNFNFISWSFFEKKRRRSRESWEPVSHKLSWTTSDSSWRTVSRSCLHDFPVEGETYEMRLHCLRD